MAAAGYDPWDPHLAIGNDLTQIGILFKVKRKLWEGMAGERLLTDHELRGIIIERRDRLIKHWVG